MKIKKRYSIPLGLLVILGAFAKTQYAKDISNTIKVIQEDKFTAEMREGAEKLGKEETPIAVKAYANQQKKLCPIKNSQDDIIIDVISENNKIIWVRKTNYEKLLQLKNINNDKIKLNRALTNGMINEICSQKAMNYLVINKDVSVEYKYFDFNMELTNNILVKKNDCVFSFRADS